MKFIEGKPARKSKFEGWSENHPIIYAHRKYTHEWIYIGKLIKILDEIESKES